MRRLFSREYWLLLLLLLAAFALRVYRLDYFSLRGDESFTVLFVLKPFAQMWNEILTVEPNPPLLYLALRGWIGLAGASEFATRYFSVFFGVLCVALIYRLAREIFRPRGQAVIAFIAAAILAINPYQIWHSQDVRNYTMWPALSLVALIFFWQWLSARGQSRAPLMWFVIAELAALYTHYYEAFTLLALNVFVFVTLWHKREKLVPWILAQLALAIFYLPYPLVWSNRVASYGEGSGKQGVALWEIAQRTFSTFMLGETLDAAALQVLWVLLAIAAGASWLWLLKQDRRCALFFALYAGIPTLAVFILNTSRPLFLERYLNGIAPAYYLVLAYGIAALGEIRWRAIPVPARRLIGAFAFAALAVVAWLGLSNYFYNPAYAKSPDWRGLTRIINEGAQRGDIIVQNFPETSLLYYDRSKLPLVVYPETYLPDSETPRALNAMNANYQRVWFVPAAPDFWDPDGYVEAWLNQHDDFLQDGQAGDLKLRLYATPSQYLDAMHKVDAQVDEVATLLGYRTAREGDRLRVVLYWRARGTPVMNYDGFARLLTADGKELAEVAHAPVDGAVPTTQWRKNQIIVDQYELPLDANGVAIEVGMLNPANGVRLPVSGTSASPNPDSIRLPLAP